MSTSMSVSVSMSGRYMEMWLTLASTEWKIRIIVLAEEPQELVMIAIRSLGPQCRVAHKLAMANDLNCVAYILKQITRPV